MELDIIPSEDEFDAYVPLERPSGGIPTTNQYKPPEPIVYSDDDCLNNSSSDDSDEVHTQLVKPNLKRKSTQNVPTANSLPNDKKKKFSIWSDILQEEAIENQFVQSEFFGGGYRGNESYNYKMKHIMEMGNNSNYRDMDRESEKSAPRKTLKAWSRNRNSSKKSPLILSDLSVTENDPPDEVASNIARLLNEEKIELIERVVNTLGNQKAIEIFNKTKDIEKNGGLLILNGDRRRTSGGVYLKLVKDEKLSKSQFEAIFRTSEWSNKNFFPKKHFKAKGKYMKKKDKLKDLPTRYELELSMCNEENEMNVLKNPPPSPVYLSSSTSSTPFSLSESAALSSHLSQASASKMLSSPNSVDKNEEQLETDSPSNESKFSPSNSMTDSSACPPTDAPTTDVNNSSDNFSGTNFEYGSYSYSPTSPRYRPPPSYSDSPSSPPYSPTSPSYNPLPPFP